MMKTNIRKYLVLACCAVLLVCMSVGATLAYLTSTDEVVNTFTVGNIQITLDETDVDINGVKDGETRVKANSYKLMPGHTYVKDPTIHIDDASEEAYLFVKLVIDDNADLKTLLAKYNLSDDLWDMLNGSVKADWTALAGAVDANNGSGTYLLTYKTTVSGATDNIKLFDSITVPQQFTVDDLKELNALKMTITAYAVQKDGFTTAADAWNATFGAN